MLIRESLNEPEEIASDEARQNAPTRRAVLTSFGCSSRRNGVTPASSRPPDWSRLGQPFTVGVGAWLTLVAVAGLAIVAGRLVVHRVAEHLPMLWAPQLCKLRRLTGFRADTCIVVALERRVMS